MTDTNARDADAIRYAVLRKLASAIRHSLMGDLQTIQFSAELAARMIDSGAGGPKLDECIKMLPEQTRAAVNSCRAMIEWLRPDEKAATAVDETLRQCLKVAGDDWSLRGIEASTDIRSGGVMVSKPMLRELLVTSLLTLVDTHPGPIDIAIVAEANGDEVVVSLSARQAGRKTQFPPMTLYRALTYDDVMTIGNAVRVPCACADGTISFRLPAIAAPA
ncbi:MAG: hypothetical protein ABI541_02375 [Betaproteobacteria bacterium]